MIVPLLMFQRVQIPAFRSLLESAGSSEQEKAPWAPHLAKFSIYLCTMNKWLTMSTWRTFTKIWGSIAFLFRFEIRFCFPRLTSDLFIEPTLPPTPANYLGGSRRNPRSNDLRRCRFCQGKPVCQLVFSRLTSDADGIWSSRRKRLSHLY